MAYPALSVRQVCRAFFRSVYASRIRECDSTARRASQGRKPKIKRILELYTLIFLEDNKGKLKMGTQQLTTKCCNQ
eukprot:scaffold189979_cov28-Tisochrysis_lutea.AAC.1